MPIPFRDAAEVDELGAAAFLAFAHDSGGSDVAGGVLLVDARGEPIEFVHHLVTLHRGVLWTREEARSYAGRRLTAELFGAVGRTPHLLLTRADEGGMESWLRGLDVEIPTGIVEQGSQDRCSAVHWLNGAPQSPSDAERLYERLAARELLVRPFGRVVRALREIYPALAGEPGSPPPAAGSAAEAAT